MFILSRIQDSIAVPPNAFGLDAQLAVKDAINLKYSNRLISGVGLAISVYDVLTCTEGTVRYGDGLIWYKTIFRVVVFAPTAGEILLGKITSTTKEHVRVSVEFFDDIYVPKSNLPKTCTFDPERKAFFYQPQDDSEPIEDPAPSPFDQPMEERIYLESDDVVRFRVEGLEWQELEPEPPNIKNRPPPVDPTTGEVIEPTPEEIELKRKLRELNAPFKVIAEMNDQGLGPTAWWTQDPEEAEEGEGDVDMD